MRLVAPNYCISTKIQSSDAGVTAEAYLFLTPESAKPVAQGKQFLPFDKAPDSLETEAERKAYIEATAKGLAHSKAYRSSGSEAGIPINMSRKIILISWSIF